MCDAEVPPSEIATRGQYNCRNQLNDAYPELCEIIRLVFQSCPDQFRAVLRSDFWIRSRCHEYSGLIGKDQAEDNARQAVLAEFVHYYNEERPHRTLELQTPELS
jgi:hypothetical protein